MPTLASRSNNMLKRKPDEAISGLVTLHRLLAMLIAVAVLFAPAFTGAAMASAAATDDRAQMADHHGQATEKGHCDPAEGEDQGGPDMTCCGAMCMALAVTPAATPLAKPLVGNVAVAALQAFGTGVPAELATPPPRVA